jgi:hypothetical protein
MMIPTKKFTQQSPNVSDIYGNLFKRLELLKIDDFCLPEYPGLKKLDQKLMDTLKKNVTNFKSVTFLSSNQVIKFL